MAAEDKYPSRVEGTAQIIERRDPVVYGNAESGPLTQQQLDEYDRNGFLFFEGFYGPDDVALMRDEMDQLRTAEEIRQSELAITEPMSGETRSIFAVQTVSDVFDKLSRDSRLLSMVQQLVGSDVYIHQSRLNLKPGFRGKEFYWHSDFETWHCEDGMPNMRAVSFSIALTDNNEFNGPLMLIPGSHKHFIQCVGRTPEDHYKSSLKKQDYGVPTNEHLEKIAEDGGIVAPKGKAGSLVLFECNTMHGSNSNISPYPRSNVFIVYNSVANALVEPFAADEPRPWFLGNRDVQPLEPVDFANMTPRSAAATA